MEANVGVTGRKGQDDAIFGETADPERYVARPLTERTLAGLEDRVVRERASTWLSAPPGMGKTLLLRVLSDRLEPTLETLYLPYTAFEFEDLCAWVLAALGHTGRSGSDSGEEGDVDASQASVRLRRHAEASSSAPERALVLLLDDAGSLPLDTARALGELVTACAGRIRLVLASTGNAQGSRVAAALGIDMIENRMAAPMTESETRDYIDTRLRAADADHPTRDRFDEEAMTRIHGMSGGNPRRIHDLASRLTAGHPLASDPDAVDEEPDSYDVLVADPIDQIDSWDEWDVDLDEPDPTPGRRSDDLH